MLARAVKWGGSMSTRKIYTLVLGLLLSLVLIGTARSAIDDGSGPIEEPNYSCSKCASSSTCGGGYASGGTECTIKCSWSTKLRKSLCSCYTIGDCDGGGGTTAPQ
jgi:hypothetical protein